MFAKRFLYDGVALRYHADERKNQEKLYIYIENPRKKLYNIMYMYYEKLYLQKSALKTSAELVLLGYHI